jgi:SAM-dependent methyltransferase
MDTWQLILLIMLLTVIVSYVIVIVRDRIIVPMPFEFDTTEGFQEETLRTDELYDKFYASVYDKIFQHDKLVQAETVLILQEWTKDRKVKDMRILDVCCGTGVATCMFAKQGVEKAVGVDKSAAMLAWAKDQMVPKTTLTDKEKAVIEWRNSDVYGPFGGAPGEFSNACLLYFSVYYLKDLDAIFKNLGVWVQPGGGLAIEVVNKHKFEPIPDVANPWVAVSPQKFSKERIVKSKAVFDKFDYETEFDLDDPDSAVTKAEFSETFRFKDGQVRRQKHTLWMPDIAIIIQKAKEQGWLYKKYVDLQFTGFNYGYMLFLIKE